MTLDEGQDHWNCIQQKAHSCGYKHAKFNRNHSLHSQMYAILSLSLSYGNAKGDYLSWKITAHHKPDTKLIRQVFPYTKPRSILIDWQLCEIMKAGVFASQRSCDLEPDWRSFPRQWSVVFRGVYDQAKSGRNGSTTTQTKSNSKAFWYRPQTSVILHEYKNLPTDTERWWRW